jgi:hypothetical protein
LAQENQQQAKQLQEQKTREKKNTKLTTQKMLS